MAPLQLYIEMDPSQAGRKEGAEEKQREAYVEEEKNKTDRQLRFLALLMRKRVHTNSRING